MKNESGGNASLLRSTDLPGEYFQVVDPSAVRISHFPPSLHNSIWDFGRGPGGRMYAALCGELGASVGVQLFEYFPDSGKLEFIFDGNAQTLAPERSIPPSKIHTSIQPTRDGKVIMTTHTTARARDHQYWLFEQNYEHLWEGFPGSHVLELDPVTRSVRTLGIPVARDSIYGACYDNRNHALWFTTFLKGHLFRLDLTTKKVDDFGQITEFGSYCLCKDSLGHIYTSSRSGHLFRIDVDQRKVSDLGAYCIGENESPLASAHRVLAHHSAGPDGRLWLSFHWSDYLHALDPHTLKIERYGPIVQGDQRLAAMPATQKGFAFDSKGVLWQAVMRPVNVIVGSTAHLFRWDVLRGKAPECFGMIGTTQRISTCIGESLMDDKDVFHLADTNHGEDPPSIIAIDTRRLDVPAPSNRPVTRDATAYMLFADAQNAYGNADYQNKIRPYVETTREYEEYGQFLTAMATTGLPAAATEILPVWELLGRGRSAVRTMRWVDDHSLLLTCDQGECEYTHSVGRIISRATWQAPESTTTELPDLLRDQKWPARCGRRYLARSTAWGRLQSGLCLIGTADGCFAFFDEATGEIFSLGSLSAHGPVHHIVANELDQRFYATVGDDEDLGSIVRVDKRTGLAALGRPFVSKQGNLPRSNSKPRSLSISPNGKRLAIGTTDALACAYVIDI
jgi:hypothetical protein